MAEFRNLNNIRLLFTQSKIREMGGNNYPQEEIAEEGGQDLGVDTVFGRVGENLSKKC